MIHIYICNIYHIYICNIYIPHDVNGIPGWIPRGSNPPGGEVGGLGSPQPKGLGFSMAWLGSVRLPSGYLTQPWKITIFNR